MPKFTLAPEDFLRSKLVDPGWYRCRVKAVTEKAAKTDQSQNVYVDLVIIQDGRFKGVPLQRVFNEKAPGFAINYIKAFGAKLDESQTQTIELASTEGKEVDAYIKRGDDGKGNPKNEVADFRPGV